MRSGMSSVVRVWRTKGQVVRGKAGEPGRGLIFL